MAKYHRAALGFAMTRRGQRKMKKILKAGIMLAIGGMIGAYVMGLIDAYVFAARCMECRDYWEE